MTFAALCFIWGSTWLGIKVGLDFLPPFTFAGFRFAIASMALLFLLRFLHAKMPRDSSSWAIMLFLGVFQISLPYGLVFWGEQYISSGLSAVLFATLTFFVVIFSHFILNERLTKLKAAGVIASFVGLLSIFWREIPASQEFAVQSSFLGSLALVGSAASGGLANVVAKRYGNRIHPVNNVFVQHVIGTLILVSVGLVTEARSSLSFTPVAIAAVFYLGVVGSALAFVGLYWLLTETTATNASLLGFVTPIVALFLGWAVLGEVPDPNMGMGAALILASVYLTVKPQGRML